MSRHAHGLINVVNSVLLAALVLATPAVAPAVTADEPAERLRRRLEAPVDSEALVVGDERLLCTVSLRRFYLGRDQALAWSRDGVPTSQADSLLALVRAADREGLNPSDYHIDTATDLLDRLGRLPDAADSGQAAVLVDLDLLLTDTFLLYGTHCLAGRLDPETIDPEWVANRRAGDLPVVLENALATDGVANTLRGLLPAQPGYARLRDLLQSLREKQEQGGWPRVPEGDRLQAGDEGPRVAALAARLGHNIASGIGDDDAADPVFDAALADEVRSFQQRNGLEADGVVGPATLKALNTPIADRIAQVVVNLERWRWLPQDLGRQHILVNIADQRLQAYSDGRPILESAVIVGRAQRRTPVFSGRITYLVFRPFWEVPPSLAVQDKLPEFRKDPERLISLGFQVFRGWGADEQEIDPREVDWNQVTARAFPFRLRQKPGPQNALGEVKFMFPNKFNVYLHDTPARELFDRSNRIFSSGCIRVQRPADLATVLLADQPEWTADAVKTTMATANDLTVRLRSPWSVHLEYWTCWVEPDGTVQFRDDIYGRDARVLAALREAPPTSP